MADRNYEQIDVRQDERGWSLFQEVSRGRDRSNRITNLVANTLNDRQQLQQVSPEVAAEIDRLISPIPSITRPDTPVAQPVKQRNILGNGLRMVKENKLRALAILFLLYLICRTTKRLSTLPCSNFVWDFLKRLCIGTTQNAMQQTIKPGVAIPLAVEKPKGASNLLNNTVYNFIDLGAIGGLVFIGLNAIRKSDLDRAKEQYDSKQYSNSIGILLALLKNHPEDLTLYLYMALNLTHLQKYEIALKLLVKLINIEKTPQHDIVLQFIKAIYTNPSIKERIIAIDEIIARINDVSDQQQIVQNSNVPVFRSA